MKRFYTADEYAQLKGVDESTVHRWTQSGKAKVVSFGQGKKVPKLIIHNDSDDDTPFILAIMNMKGGCGKTMISCHLATLLSKINFRVLIIDTDHQNQCESFFPEQNYDYTIKDALLGNQPITRCIYPTYTKTSELSIIYSDYSLALIEDQINSMDRLAELVATVQHDFDFIVIDTSPSFYMLNRNVARTATHIIVPIVPVTLHTKGMTHFFDGIRQVAKVSDERVCGIVPNMVNEKLVQHRSYLEILRDDYPDLMYDTIIPLDNRIPKVNDRNSTIFDEAEKSKASQALKQFTWETLRRLNK
jgi:chromosome partitioning protein